MKTDALTDAYLNLEDSIHTLAVLTELGRDLLCDDHKTEEALMIARITSELAASLEKKYRDLYDAAKSKAA